MTSKSYDLSSELIYWTYVTRREVVGHKGGTFGDIFLKEWTRGPRAEPNF